MSINERRGRPYCDHCKKRQCNKRFRVPYIGKNRRTSYVNVCGNCCHNRMSEVRAWLDRLEEEAKG